MRDHRGTIGWGSGASPPHAHTWSAADLPHRRRILPLGKRCYAPPGDLLCRWAPACRAALPGNVEARIGRGWASLLAGRDREAAELWRPVITLTRNGPTLERMLALYRALGDAAAAAEVERTMARAVHR
jgi:hypothetical protein